MEINGYNFFSQFLYNWRVAFRNSRFRTLFIAGLILLFIVVWAFNLFFQWVQKREGLVMNDVILNLFTPVDLSVPIYLVINSLTAFSIILILKNPLRFLQTLYAYILVSSLRMLVIYLTPLNPPVGIIPLNDPFLMAVTYGHVMITKDLFFSGHIATMALILLAVEARWMKWLLFLGTVFVAVGIIIMRAHYSIDVFAAPLFSVLSWVTAKKFLLRVGKREEKFELEMVKE